MKSKTLSTFLAAGAVLWVLTLSTSSFGQDKITFCHENTDGTFGFVDTSINGAINGHDYDPNTGTFSSGAGQDGHETDYLADSASDCERGTPDGPTDPSAVPEPITMLLFGAGIAGVGYATRRLRKKGDTENDPQD